MQVRIVCRWKKKRQHLQLQYEKTEKGIQLESRGKADLEEEVSELVEHESRLESELREKDKEVKAVAAEARSLQEDREAEHKHH